MLKNLVNLAILTTIVIAVWVFVSIYNSFTSSTITTNVARQIEPISPNFNKDAVSSLLQRTFIPTDLSEKIILPTGTPETDTGSASAQINTGQSIAQGSQITILTPTSVPTISNK